MFISEPSSPKSDQVTNQTVTSNSLDDPSPNHPSSQTHPNQICQHREPSFNQVQLLNVIEINESCDVTPTAKIKPHETIQLNPEDENSLDTSQESFRLNKNHDKNNNQTNSNNCVQTLSKDKSEQTTQYATSEITPRQKSQQNKKQNKFKGFYQEQNKQKQSHMLIASQSQSFREGTAGVFQSSNSRKELLNLNKQATNTTSKETLIKQQSKPVITAPIPLVKADDKYQIVQLIGIGTFGKIYLAQTINTTENNEQEFALKVISKDNITSLQQANQIVKERQVMQLLTEHNCLYVPHLYQTSKSSKQLELKMQFVRGCEISKVIRKLKKFWQFYAAEVMCALECMHELNVVYRDLKPEHVLIDSKGHCKIVDFGLSAIVKNNGSLKCYTNCGTPEYVAPEVLKAIGSSYEADIWSLGVFMHELITGETPFHNENPQKIYDAVLKCKPKYSPNITIAQKQLLEQIFVCDPGFRLTIPQIKKFELVFGSLNWAQAAKRELPAPWVPIEGAAYHNCTQQPKQQPTLKKKSTRKLTVKKNQRKLSITQQINMKPKKLSQIGFNIDFLADNDDKNGKLAIRASMGGINHYFGKEQQKKTWQDQVTNKSIDVSKLNITHGVVQGDRKKKDVLGNFWYQNVDCVLANF